MNHYDVIVIGAGNAGLSAAATTSLHGLKTLVIERNSVPGGCATSFCRGRFEFEAALHELANIGYPDRPGSVRKLFDEYGVNVNWHIEKQAFRAIVSSKDGYDVTMPMGVDAFCEEMERQVPGSRDSVEAVFDLARRADAALSYLSQGKPDPKVLMEEHTDFLRMASHTVDEGLNALGMPKKAQHILSTYWSYLGVPTDQLDFMHYAIMLQRYVNGGPALPELRSHEISLALEASIREHGGEFWYNTEVTKILTKGGKAYGVAIGEKEIYAPKIISNAFPDVVYAELMQRDEVPARAVKLINARTNGAMFFTVYLGLNRSAEELGIKDYSVFLFDSPNTREQFDSCGDAEKSFIIVNCLNNAIPNSSPAGTCTLFFTTMLTEDAWGDVDPKDYKRIKNRIAERMIKTYEERLGVTVRSHIEEIVISSPATFARYLNTPGGTPYGYEISVWDSMIARIMNKGREQFTDGLYFVGAHGERADGYSSAYSNGHSVGEKVAKEVKQNGTE